MTSLIVSLIFLVIPVAVLIYLLIGKGPLAGSKFKNFYRASCGVYVSGSVLIFVFTLLFNQLPVAFVVISNVTILFVFCFTAGLILFMTKKMIEPSKNSGNKTDDGKKD